MRSAVAVRVIAPNEAVTVTGNVPTVAVSAAVIVMAAVIVGVIGLGTMLTFVPVGNPVTVNVTGELKP